MFEQILYFYRRNERKLYTIRPKGDKTSSLFTGDNERDLENDLENLENGSYVIYVANSPTGYNNCPERPFDVRKTTNQQNQNPVIPQALDIEKIIKESYEKGKEDFKREEQERENKEVLVWLKTVRPHIDKFIKDLEDDDPTNDEDAKTGFMDAIGEIPDLISSLDTIMNLGKTVD